MKYYFLFSFPTFILDRVKRTKKILSQIDKAIIDNFKEAAPGCAVLIAKEGKIILEKGCGTSNLELDVAIKPEMVFRIGSITKQFTAIGSNHCKILH